MKSPTFGNRNRSPGFSRRVDPERDRIRAIRECCVRRFNMGRTSGQLRDFGDKSLVLVAPVDDDLVFVHQSSPQRPCRVIMARIAAEDSAARTRLFGIGFTSGMSVDLARIPRQRSSFRRGFRGVRYRRGSGSLFAESGISASSDANGVEDDTRSHPGEIICS